LGWSPLDAKDSKLVPAGAAAITSAGAEGGFDKGEAKVGAVVITRAASANLKVRVIANSKWVNPENNRDTA
jgi:hypothetical protein